MKIVEWVKDHPYITAGGVFVVGLILIISLSGDNTEEIVEPSLGGYVPYNDNAAANMALVQTQLSAQVAAKQADNALAAIQAETDAAYKTASKQFEYLNNAAILSKDIAFRGYQTEDTKNLYAKETTLGVAQANRDIQIAGINAAATAAAMAADVEKYRIGNEAMVANNIAHAKAWESTTLKALDNQIRFNELLHGVK